MHPIEPPPSNVVFPDPRRARRRLVLAVGVDFTPSTLLSAYRAGIFPWPESPENVAWCSPDPRAIFPLDIESRWSRSLRRTLRTHTYSITINQAFADVVVACGERDGGTWIIPELVSGYVKLHQLGWAHSVEVWEQSEWGAERQLVGGIYGVSIGGLFAGESMFHRRTDASKIAFASLVDRLKRCGFTLFDVQVMNSHLQSLGCIEISRKEYLDKLDVARELHCSLS